MKRRVLIESNLHIPKYTESPDPKSGLSPFKILKFLLFWYFFIVIRG